MKERRAIRVTVYLDIGSDPLSGTVAIDEQEQRSFQGWIELADAIGRAHALALGESEQVDPPG